MPIVPVDLKDTAYEIHIQAGLLDDVRPLLAVMPQKRVAIVTNETVAPLYLSRLKTALLAHGVRSIDVILPDGEAYKTWETLNQILDALLQDRCERKTTLLALGGGVVGDMTGFAAAIYQRGIPFIQIPTTLLAQVDSSVGGKTGINHPLGKNMIGAFYQPKYVHIDPCTLMTLPQREFVAGLAEVIKYGLIDDLEFFVWLEAHMPALLLRESAVLVEAIAWCCRNKARIVAEDEREETGVRALLNLGHTFGHAIEAGLGYGVWLHGEAVAAGMVLAARASVLRGTFSDADLARVLALIKAAELPVDAPCLGWDRWMSLMAQDKKVVNDNIQFVLLERLGKSCMGVLDEVHLRQLLY